VVNYRDWGIQLGRRFRALKLWFVIRSYGVEGLRAMIREHVRLGGLLGTWISGDQAFELMAPPLLGLVVFRYRGEATGNRQQGTEDLDGLNRGIQERVNATGKIFITGTRLSGRYVLRVALGHLTTSEADVRAAWEMIREAARAR
jgi:aromatic-L-amino-acid decarboxylase